MSQKSNLNHQNHPISNPKCKLTLASGLIAILIVMVCMLNFSTSGGYNLGVIQNDETEIDHSQELHGRLESKNNSGREVSAKFDLTREDSLLVFVHIQKTGGTEFGKHLLKDLKRFSCPCTVVNKHKRRHCRCYHTGSHHQLWYFSRYTRGWVCGVHPDYTTLRHCLPQLFQSRSDAPLAANADVMTPTYLYVTFIRDPVQRYLSEFRHTSLLGAKWPVIESRCKNQKLQFSSFKSSKQSFSPCLPEGESDWRGVSLEGFMGCELNPAANRMTRMLADLTEIACAPDLKQDRVEMEKKMLESAKRNLEQFAYFGLTEDQRGSQKLFERTFGVEFSKSFDQQQTHASGIQVSPDLERRIKSINHLDVELYEWAKQLFHSRLD